MIIIMHITYLKVTVQLKYKKVLTTVSSAVWDVSCQSLLNQSVLQITNIITHVCFSILVRIYPLFLYQVDVFYLDPYP